MLTPTSKLPLIALTTALILPSLVSAHIALWDEAMYGLDDTDPNQQDAVIPLYHEDFNDWWFHGYVNKPPKDGVFMNLVSEERDAVRYERVQQAF